MIGTRGVPAHYGGFETAVEEVGARLAARGHQVVVYCRGGDSTQTHHRGMELVQLPAVRRRALETLNHTVTSTLDVRRADHYDAILLFNAANALTLPLLRKVASGIALHVDGLEWQRGKWSRLGRAWYLVMERYGARRADELIADARGIQAYYKERYGVPSRFIPYGAPLIEVGEPRHLASLGLTSGEFHLVVARLEPENHVEIAIEAYVKEERAWPLVVVGSVPYETDYSRTLYDAAATSQSIMMLGGVWEPDKLDELYATSGLYVHGHSVGGTNPSLLRAMGAGAPVAAFDVVFNREVLGDTGRFFGDAAALSQLMTRAELAPDSWRARGQETRIRAAAHYDWDQVASAYEQLCADLAHGGGRRQRR
jgi:glycosyltransferase involved in cell wall biosynthesis